MISKDVIKIALLANVVYCGYQLKNATSNWDRLGCGIGIVFALDAYYNKVNGA